MTPKHKRLAQVICLGCLFAAAAPSFARVLQVHVDHRATILGGRSFGKAGPYEKISGTVVFGFDPDNPANRRITDIEKAPLDAQGLVEASANFMVLKPADERRSRHVAWLEVSNRGGKASLKYFNDAASFASDPVSADDFGNGLLMRQGPPASSYPKIADGTLVSIDKLAFPSIPGIKPPRVAEVAHRVNYGPRWNQGIITNQPPKLGPKFPIRVPQVNALGNERAGIENVEVTVPLATYAPWNLRTGLPHPEELTDFLGTFIPLPRSAAEKRTRKDPRPAIAMLYKHREHYLDRVKRAADKLVQEGFLLKEDRERVLGHARRQWNWLSRHRCTGKVAEKLWMNTATTSN